MTAPRLALLAALGSATLLAGAFLFQVAGYAPCKLCLWQRWPHAIAIGLGLAALALGQRVWLWLGAFAATTTAAIGIYHAGVEWRLWEGPTSCSGGGAALGGLSGADLLSTEAAAPIVMCDEIVWQLLGLSMAGWNAVFSILLTAIWIAAALHRRPEQHVT